MPEPDAGLAVAADDGVPAGFAASLFGVALDAAEDEDAEPAGLSAGLAATFSGFRSIVTGRFEPVPPVACFEAEPAVPGFCGSPEPAEPEEEDLPLAGPFSDAISSPPNPDQRCLIPLYTPACEKIPR